MSQVGTSQADLIGLLNLSNNPLDIATFAEFAGFERVQPQANEQAECETPLNLDDQAFEANCGDVEQAIVRTETTAQSARTAWFWQPVSRKQIPSDVLETDAPLWWRAACTIGQRREERSAVTKPSVISLVHWPRFSAFFRHQCTKLRNSSTLDELLLVRQLASGRCLKRLPRKSVRRWPHRVVLIRDRTAELFPLQSDFRLLEKRLFELLRSQITMISLDDSDMAQADFESIAQRGKLSLEELTEASWLILSDLGSAVINSPRRQFWQSFLGWLRDIQVRDLPLVLAPNSEISNLPGLNYLARTAFWDIDRPLRITRVYDDSANQPNLTPFLATLAMATEARPNLLRKLRLLLTDPHYDMGSELAVWNHNHVLRSPPTCFINPRVRSVYRKAFYDMRPGLRNKVQEVIKADHLLDWPVVRDTENEHFSVLSGETNDNPDYIGDGVYTLVKHPEFFDHAIFLRWAKQYITQTEDTLIAASEKLAALKEAILIVEAARDGYRKVGDRRFSFLTRNLPAINYQLLQIGPELQWVRGSMDRGSPVVRNAMCGTVVKIDDNLQGISSYVSVDFAIPADSERVTIVTADARIELNRIHRPDWASAMGRDERGLFTMIRADGRRLEWCEPGFVVLKEKDAREIARWRHEKGFWHDVASGGASGIELARPDWASKFGLDSLGVYADFEVDGVVQRLRWMMPGTFPMGSPANEHARVDNEMQHDVILSRGFWLADTVCTQALWTAVMGNNPSRFKGKDRPVEQVSWNDVQKFLTALNKRLPGLNAALPTEAQWESACRAGTAGPFSFGESVTAEQANFNGNYPYRDQDPKGEYRKETVAVNAFPPNNWGLYQMHGNVWEWCRDGFGEYTSASAVDPVGPEDKPRVVRGGSWVNYARGLRSAYRYPGARADRDDRGFRLSRGPELQAGAAEPLKKTKTGERRAEPPRSRAQKLHGPKRSILKLLRDGLFGAKDASDEADEP